MDIRFQINHSLALVGQSGSGKSLTLKALLGMLPSTLKATLDIEATFTCKRGEDIAFVPQNPFTALSPLTKIKDQFLLEDEEITHYLQMVDLESALMERFPPELSGGQLQRVIIAMALSQNPKLLLMDEPTTALDSKTRDMILALILSLQDKAGFLLLFVTHDMASAKMLCQEIAVIHEGRIVEHGAMNTVIKSPKHPYTQRLIEAGFKTRGFRQ